jgi:hypothetical protein
MCTKAASGMPSSTLPLGSCRPFTPSTPTTPTHRVIATGGKLRVQAGRLIPHLIQKQVAVDLKVGDKRLSNPVPAR